MSDAGNAAGEPAVGSVELEESDLRPVVIEMSGVLRARVALTFILGIFFVSALAFSVDGWGTKVQLIVLPVLFLGILWVSPVLSARRLLQAIAKGGDRHASYRFDDDGLTARTAGSTMTVAYRSLVEYREARTALLLYTAPNVASIVPLRAFTPDALARVRTLLAANVKVRRKGSPNRLILLWVALVFAFLVLWQFLNVKAQLPPPDVTPPTGVTL